MQHTTIEIMGGLGNQLFQIFALLAHCLHYKLPFYFSTQPIQHGQRKQTYWHTPLLQSLQPFVKPPPSSISPTLLREQGFHYQPIPFYDQAHVKPTHVKPTHVKLFGYFQSYKYFQAQAEQIYKLLRVKQTQDLIKTKTSYNYTNLIAVHFRVGDYVQLPNHHPLMTLDYYKEALSQFLQDQSTALCETLEEAKQIQSTWNILYFCEKNDQSYVEKQFIQPLQAHPHFQGKFHFQCIDHQLADWEQVIVMSLCQYHIIANSTFSWWGAYMGGHPPPPPYQITYDKTSASAQKGGVPLCVESPTTPASSTTPTSASAQHGGVWGVKPPVYYPSLWFGPAMGQKNMTDLFPPHWKKIILS